MKKPEDKPPVNTPFEQVDEAPTSKRQFGSHRGDWWLDVNYSEDIDMNKAIDTKAAREKRKP